MRNDIYILGGDNMIAMLDTQKIGSVRYLELVAVYKHIVPSSSIDALRVPVAYVAIKSPQTLGSIVPDPSETS